MSPRSLAGPRLRRTAVVVATALVALSTAIAAANGSGSAGGTVTVRLASDWPNFDPQIQGPSLMPFITAPYDRLVAIGPGTKIVPYLATSWQQTPRSIVFTIRKDAICTDGTKVTPTVIAKSFQRLITVPKLSNVLPQDFGPGPYSVSADDKRGTFTFRAGTPYRAMLYGFADGPGDVICPDGLANPDKLQTEWHGSGAYTLVSAAHGDQVTMKVRPEWKWGPLGRTSKDLPDTQVWKVITDDTTAANLLLTGGLDIASFFGGPDAERLQSNSSLTHTASPIFFTQNIVFNSDPGTLTSDEAFRKAVSMAVDPKAWNQAANAGHGKAVTSFVLPNDPCFDPKTKQLYPKYDINAAKQVLTQAGYKNVGQPTMTTANGTPVKYGLLTFTGFSSGGEYLLAQLRQLGGDITLRNLVGTLYGQANLRHDFDVTVTTTNNGATDTIIHMGFYYGPVFAKGGQNLYGPYSDPAWDRYMRLAAGTVGKVSCGWLAKAQELALQKSYFMPLVAPVFDVFTQKNVSWIRGPRFLDPILITKK
jgi:peptide/nickel transport system substrate-binding protein